MKISALWFINEEIENTLSDLERGIINKDHAIGSLSTLYSIASKINEGTTMQTICIIIAYIRNTHICIQICKNYRIGYFSKLISETK
jgi:hypothetical protein